MPLPDIREFATTNALPDITEFAPAQSLPDIIEFAPSEQVPEIAGTAEPLSQTAQVIDLRTGEQMSLPVVQFPRTQEQPQGVVEPQIPQRTREVVPDSVARVLSRIGSRLPKGVRKKLREKGEALGEFTEVMEADMEGRQKALWGSFHKGLHGQGFAEKEQNENPMMSGIGQLMGEVSALHLVSLGLGSIGLAGKITSGGQKILTKLGVSAIRQPQILAFMARVAHNAAMFGGKESIQKGIKVASGEELTMADVKEVAKETGFGATLGLVNSISSPLRRIPAALGIGFGAAKMDGASNQDAAISASVFGIVSAFQGRGMEKQFRLQAFKQTTADLKRKLTELGRSPEEAQVIVDQFFTQSALKATGEKSIDKALEKILTNKKITLKWWEQLDDAINAYQGSSKPITAISPRMVTDPIVPRITMPKTAVPAVQAGVKSVATPKSFGSTEEALAWGKAHPEAAESLRQESNKQADLVRKLGQAGDPATEQAMVDAGSQQSLFSEAAQAAEAARTVPLFHVGVSLEQGQAMTPDARGLVWFSPSKTKYGADRPDAPVTQVNIPRSELLIVEDQQGRTTPEGEAVVAATESGSKQQVFEEAERRGYKAVQRGFDVSMRPETAAQAAERAQTTQEAQTPSPAEIGPTKAAEAAPAMSTKAQKALAHAKAEQVGLIAETKSGKKSVVRFRRLAKGITGKTSTKQMTKDEISDFIDAMDTLEKRRPWEPPVIPMSTKVVPKDFFEAEFRTPGLASVLTPKEYYMRRMGAGPLLEPVTTAKKEMFLESHKINKWIDDVVKRINKEAKVSVTEKAAAAILNKPTKPIAKMRDLLDQYEEAPQFLSAEEQEIFTELRGFTKEMLARTNVVRERLGMDPIGNIKTYIPHYLDELASQIVEQRYPFPEDVKFWLGKKLPKTPRNPSALKRRVSDELGRVFSKDLGKLLKAMSKYDLRDIYLTEPYSVIRAQLNALGDKIPAALRKDIDDYLRHDIFNWPTELDKLLNSTLEMPTRLVNKVLHPLNRVITNPIRSISSMTRRLVISATLPFRPRLAIRNVTQRLLLTNIYPLEDVIKAQLVPLPEEVMEKIEASTFYRLSTIFEDVATGTAAERLGMWAYGKAHKDNVRVAMKTGWNYGNKLFHASMDPTSKFYKYAAKRAQRDGVPIEQYLWTEEDRLLEAIEAASVTQWLYFTTDMPQLFRGQTTRLMMTLQSWWQNYFFKHVPEFLRRAFDSTTSRGKLIPPEDRWRYLQGLAVILGTTEGVRRATGLDYKRFLFMLGPAPATMSPPGQLVLGLWKYLTATTERGKADGLRQIKYSWRAFVPGSMAWRDLMKFINEEATLKEYLFYTEQEES